MQFIDIQRIFFAEDSVPKDDIDTLFEKLEQLEPPSSLIEQILKLTVKTPSTPPPLSDLSLYDPWTELDGLVIRNDKQKPS